MNIKNASAQIYFIYIAKHNSINKMFISQILVPLFGLLYPKFLLGIFYSIDSDFKVATVGNAVIYFIHLQFTRARTKVMSYV